MLWLFSKYLFNVSKNIFSSLSKKNKMFLDTLQVLLWQPVVVEHIKENREVHFYVRASSTNSIKAQLRQLTIQHKYVFFICCHECFCKVICNLCNRRLCSFFVIQSLGGRCSRTYRKTDYQWHSQPTQIFIILWKLPFNERSEIFLL